MEKVITNRNNASPVTSNTLHEKTQLLSRSESHTEQHISHETDQIRLSNQGSISRIRKIFSHYPKILNALVILAQVKVFKIGRKQIQGQNTKILVSATKATTTMLDAFEIVMRGTR